jgi:hypothetical protein
LLDAIKAETGFPVNELTKENINPKKNNTTIATVIRLIFVLILTPPALLGKYALHSVLTFYR